jgi:hypothetical protein
LDSARATLTVPAAPAVRGGVSLADERRGRSIRWNLPSVPVAG